MGRLNVFKTIEKQKKTGVNERYDIPVYDIIKIKDRNNNWFYFATDMFYLGYAQGQKALLAEQKKLGV